MDLQIFIARTLCHSFVACYILSRLGTKLPVPSWVIASQRGEEGAWKHSGSERGTAMIKLGKTTFAIIALLLVFLITVSSRVQGQTQTTGDIAGTVTDPTGAVVPGATVSLKDVNQGAIHDT